MSKAVLFSIKPNYCEQIIGGKKTVEVRKRIPKISVPFTAYIYETKGRYVMKTVDIPPEHGGGIADMFIHEGRGKVIGEFVCNNIDWHGISSLIVKEDAEHTLKGTCLSKDEVLKYIGYQKGTNIYAKDYSFYGLHISELVIYKEPKDLSEFEKPWCDINGNWQDIRPCENGKHCEHDVFDYSENTSACSIDFSGENCPYTKITRPPQSWCYVEKLRGVG